MLEPEDIETIDNAAPPSPEEALAIIRRFLEGVAA